MKLTIIGASGHGRVVADIAERCGYTEIEFLDDNPQVKECGGYPVVGPSSLTQGISNDLFVAIGNNTIRARILDDLIANGHSIAILIHPDAVLAKDVEVGVGTVVMAGVVINANVKIGKGCILNTCSSIDHDCLVGDYVHVAVDAHVCGTVKIGADTWIGAGATVINNVDICPGCLIGAGAVVVKNITTKGTYMGIPAKNISHRTDIYGK